jgi:hypothetical protein
MGKCYIGLILIPTILLSCSIFSHVPAGETNNVEHISADDAVMNAAIQEAQDTLPLFIHAFQFPRPTQTY